MELYESFKKYQIHRQNNYSNFKTNVKIHFCNLVIYTQLSLKFWKYKEDCRIQREWMTSGEHSPLNKLNSVNLGSQEHGILSWECMTSFTQMLWLLAWCFWGTPNSSSGCVFDNFVCSWDFFLLLPSFRVRDFTLSSVTPFVQVECPLLETCYFLNSKWGWVDLGKRKGVGVGEVEGGELRLGCIIWEKNLFLTKKKLKEIVWTLGKSNTKPWLWTHGVVQLVNLNLRKDPTKHTFQDTKSWNHPLCLITSPWIKVRI